MIWPICKIPQSAGFIVAVATQGSLDLLVNEPANRHSKLAATRIVGMARTGGIVWAIGNSFRCCSPTWISGRPFFGTSSGIVLAALLLPIVLGVFSKRVIVLLACTLLAAIAFCAVVAPTSIAVTLATGAYFGGLIVAVAGMGARRRTGALQAKLANLRADVDRLLSAEERHYLTQLRS